MEYLSFVGLDLSGPAAPSETGVAVFHEKGTRLILESGEHSGSDEAIYQLVERLASSSKVIVGIDSPLSYAAGGGLRIWDRSLQTALQQIGMHPRHALAPMARHMVGRWTATGGYPDAPWQNLLPRNSR